MSEVRRWENFSAVSELDGSSSNPTQEIFFVHAFLFSLRLLRQPERVNEKLLRSVMQLSCQGSSGVKPESVVELVRCRD